MKADAVSVVVLKLREGGGARGGTIDTDVKGERIRARRVVFIVVVAFRARYLFQ